VGRNGPIGSEVYLRSGISVPIGGGVYGSVMKPGWDIEGGVRTLLFNRDETAAWTADLSITNVHYYTSTGKQFILANVAFSPPSTPGMPSSLINLPEIAVSPVGLNDTTVNLSFGRECYLVGAATCHGEPQWRIGGDFGGRWGSSRIDLFAGPQPPKVLALGVTQPTAEAAAQHRTGAIEGFFFSLHTDVEIPCWSCCILFAGLRLEYSYTISHILQEQNDTLLQGLNFMATVGLRF
jgi:hypothetical protein